MTKIVITIGIVIITFSHGCAPAVATYPSYNRAVAKYQPPKAPSGVRVDGDGCDAAGDGCECPRQWYYDRWIYDCEGQYLYWDNGYWYQYGGAYYHRFDGPYAPRPHKARRVTTE